MTTKLTHQGEARKLSFRNFSLTLIAGLAVLGWCATLAPQDALAQSRGALAGRRTIDFGGNRSACPGPVPTGLTTNTRLTTSNGEVSYTIYRFLAGLQQYMPEPPFYLEAHPDRSQLRPEVL
jgi:hypothetical protein